MPQLFKSIYFPDRKEAVGAPGLTLAFSSKNKNLYDNIAELDSKDIRSLLGTHSFSELEYRANQEGLPINTYCIWYLRKNFESGTHQLELKQKPHKSANTKNSKSIFFSDKYSLNQIYNINCLELMDNIKDHAIDLIFADPPYNLSKSSFKMRFKKSGGADLNTNKGSWDKYTDEEFEKFTHDWLSESFRILRDGGALWVAGSYHNIYLTGYLMKKIGFEILNEVLWHKPDATPNLSCTRFVADHENFIWARKGKGNTFNYALMKEINGGKQMRSLWTRGKTAGGKKVHPTQKPEWLLDRVIAASSRKNDIVFDPFIGSGTTALVAKKQKRRYLGSELDKTYFEIAVDRINNTP